MKILMFYHGGSNNRGCEAIVRSGVTLIKKQIPNAIVDLASWKPETDVAIPLIDTIYLDRAKSIKKFSLQWMSCLFQYKFFKNENYALRVIHSDLIKLIPNYDIIFTV